MKRSMMILLLGLAGCSSGMTTDAVAPAENPVIVRVVSRDSTIVARATGQGTVYSVENKAGQTVVPSMTLQQMQASNPNLAHHVRTMNASADHTAWAGVE